MAIETLGVIKMASALKCAVTGLAGAVPPLIHNSALASQQLATVVTPVIVAGAVALGTLVAKGAAAAQAGIASLTAAATKTAAGIAAATQPAATGAVAAAAQPAATTAANAAASTIIASTL